MLTPISIARSGFIASGQVGWPHHASGAVRSGHVGDGSVLSGGVGSGQIASGHLASGVVANLGVNSGSVGSGAVASGAVQGFFGTTPNVASGTLGVWDFGSGAIIAGAVGSGSIRSGNVASGQIGSTHLADGSVLTIDIGSGQIQSGQVGSGAVFGQALGGFFCIASGSITTSDMGSGAVVSGLIASGQIGRFHIASGQLAGFELGSGAIVSGRIASGQVGNAHLGSGAVLSGHIGSGQVGFRHLASASVIGQAVGGYVIASGTIMRFDMADGAVFSGNVGSGQVTTFHLASGTIVTQAALVTPFISGGLPGGLWVMVTEETVSGGRAVSVSPSGNIRIAMASISGRMPAVGVVDEGVLSGIQVTVHSIGPVQFTSGLVDFSGYVGQSVFVGRSGEIVTASGSWNSGGFLSGDVHQIIGLVFNSGTIVAHRDAPQSSGGPTLGSGVVTSGSIGAAVASGIPLSGSVTGAAGGGFRVIASGTITTNDVGSGAVVSGLVASGQVGQFHVASGAITSGRLGVTGVPTGTKVLQDDFSWVTLGAASVNSGDIIPEKIASGVGARYVTPITSGLGLFRPITEEIISGVRAVHMSQSGGIRIAMASVSGRRPAIGVLANNVASGIEATVFSMGMFKLTSGLGDFSGFLGVPVLLGRSGEITTSGQLLSGDAYQELGIAWSSGDILIQVQGQAVSGSTLGSGIVISGSIASGQVGSFHVASGGILSGNIASGQIGSNHLASGSVLSGHIASGQVGQFHLASGSVTSGAVSSGVVGSFHIASGGVLSGNIASGQIGPNHLGSGAVLSGHVASGQLGRFHVGSGQLAGFELGSGAIVSGRIASGQIGDAHLGSGVVLSGHIASGVVWGLVGTGPHIASGSFTGFELGSGAIVSGRIASGQVGSFHIASGGVLSGNIASGQIGVFHLGSGAVQSGVVASGQLGQFHFASGIVVNYVAPVISGLGIYTPITEETISGIRAVHLSQSGQLRVAMASLSGRRPAIGVVKDNVASGIQAIVYTMGLFKLTSGLGDFSGFIGLPLLLGRSGELTTSGSLLSGDVYQQMGISWTSGDMLIQVNAVQVSGGPGLGSGAVTSGTIGLAVTSGVPLSGSVTGAAGGGFRVIASGTITTNDLGSGAIQSGNIASGQVGNTHIASGGVLSGNVASGQVGQFHLGSGVVTSGAISSGVIGRFHVASGQLAGFELGSGAIVSGRIASGQIGNFHVASGQVQGIAGGGVPNIASGTLGGFELGSGAVVSGRIASGVVGQFHVASGAVTSGRLGVTTAPDGTKFLRDDFTWQAAGGSVASGDINQNELASGVGARWVATIVSGLNPFTSGMTEEAVSGIRAVCISQSGNIRMAMASVSGRMPAVGVVIDNVASGIQVNVYQYGMFIPTSGLVEQSGYGSQLLYVGRSGQVVTSSGGFNSGGLLSGDIVQPLGYSQQPFSGAAAGNPQPVQLAVAAQLPFVPTLVYSGDVGSGNISNYDFASGAVINAAMGLIPVCSGGLLTMLTSEDVSGIRAVCIDKSMSGLSVRIAMASVSGRMPAVGVVRDNVASGIRCNIVMAGPVVFYSGIVASGFQMGKRLYVCRSGHVGTISGSFNSGGFLSGDIGQCLGTMLVNSSGGTSGVFLVNTDPTLHVALSGLLVGGIGAVNFIF